jgi:hypothetical protein
MEELLKTAVGGVKVASEWRCSSWPRTKRSNHEARRALMVARSGGARRAAFYAECGRLRVVQFLWQMKSRHEGILRQGKTELPGLVRPELALLLLDVLLVTPKIEAIPTVSLLLLCKIGHILSLECLRLLSRWRRTSLLLITRPGLGATSGSSSCSFPLSIFFQEPLSVQVCFDATLQ